MPEDYRTRLIPFDVTMILENSFGYFETIQDDARVLKEVVRVLEPRGRLLADVTDAEYLRTHHQPRSWEWIDRNILCAGNLPFPWKEYGQKEPSSAKRNLLLLYRLSVDCI